MTRLRAMWTLWAAWGLLLVLVPQAARAQEPTCETDHNCGEGYYCSPEPGAHCEQCVNCTEMNRAAPGGGGGGGGGAGAGGCARSVLECGGCFEGFIESLLIAGSCVRGRRDPPPYYVWVPVLVCLAVVLVALLLICMPKIRRAYAHSTRRASAYGDPESKETATPRAPAPGPDAEPRASAPTPPPPYNLNVYNTSLREGPESPLLPGVHFGFPPSAYGESLPAVNKSDSAQHRGQKENDFNQEAIVYNRPSYGHPVLPPSYVESDEPEVHDLPHDEDTMESVWTPATDQPATSLSPTAMLKDSSDEPPSKVLCVRGREASDRAGRVRYAEAVEMPSTSSGSSQGPGPAAPSPAPAPAPAPSQPEPPRETNVTLNINFQQLNDVKLLRT